VKLQQLGNAAWGRHCANPNSSHGSQTEPVCVNELENRKFQQQLFQESAYPAQGGWL